MILWFSHRVTWEPNEVTASKHWVPAMCRDHEWWRTQMWEGLQGTGGAPTGRLRQLALGTHAKHRTNSILIRNQSEHSTCSSSKPWHLPGYLVGIRHCIGNLLHCYVAYVNMTFIRYSLVVLKVTECSYVFLCGILNFLKLFNIKLYG